MSDPDSIEHTFAHESGQGPRGGVDTTPLAWVATAAACSVYFGLAALAGAFANRYRLSCGTGLLLLTVGVPLVVGRLDRPRSGVMLSAGAVVAGLAGFAVVAVAAVVSLGGS